MKPAIAYPQTQSKGKGVKKFVPQKHKGDYYAKKRQIWLNKAHERDRQIRLANSLTERTKERSISWFRKLVNLIKTFSKNNL